MTTRLRPSRIGPFSGGGVAGVLLRSRDWSATELGAVDAWPRLLRFALRFALRSRGPAALFWGPRLFTFYNDAWIPLAGDRHPQAFGAAPGGELWAALAPSVRRAYATGEAGGIDDVPWGDRRYSFALTPLGSEEDVDGLYCAAVDQTRRSRAERQFRLLRELDAAGSDARAVELLAAELGFAWIYRVESDGDAARLSAAAGRPAPPAIRLSRPPPWPSDGVAQLLMAPGERRPSGLLVAGGADAEGGVRLAARLLAGPRDAESLAYTVAHDLRAPLRAMTSFSEALLEEPGLSEEARGLAVRIAGAGRRADVLVRDLLDYSHLGRERVELRETDLEALVAEALANLEETLRERGAAVEVVGPLPKARAHAPSLRRALENLISNAAKFTAPGVSPRVRIRREGRRLWVEDNGIGISPEHQERVFGIFERLHRPEAYPGTGVGLAIVRRAMERMGGKAGVESELGRGSRFYLEFPGVE